MNYVIQMWDNEDGRWVVCVSEDAAGELVEETYPTQAEAETMARYYAAGSDVAYRACEVAK